LFLVGVRMMAMSTALPVAHRRLGVLPSIVLVVIASLVLGAATFFAQGVFPDVISSFANSASGWTLVTVALVWLLHQRTWASAVLGLIGFVGLVAGYTVAAELRGIHYGPLVFGIIGVVAGPFVGIAASWLHREAYRAASAAAVLAGIAIGESVYGLTMIAATTSPFYWILIGALGTALLAAVLIRRVNRPATRILAIAATATIATAFCAAYTAVGLLAFR
jgi:hypothetical protein